MPSPEARLLSLASRWLVKRRVDGATDIALVRRAMSNPLPPLLPKGMRVEPSTAPGLKGEWLIPADHAPRRTILYLHGGGYVACAPQTYRGLTSWIAARSRAKVFALDYRLAPEHPFPAGLNDAVAAVRALYAQGVASAALGIAGDSAGGGLTLATLHALKAAGDPLPAAAALLSPWTDLTGSGDSVRTNAESEAMLPPAMVRPTALMYAGDVPLDDPRVSPLFSDLRGIPSLLVQVSDSEILFDDSKRLVERAREAGVAVEFEVWSGLSHVWQIGVPLVRESRTAVGGIGAYFARRTG